MDIDLKPVEAALAGREGDATALIETLQDVQRRFNYLPRPALNLVAERLRVPLSRVYAAATFYSAFSLVPRGRCVVRLCKGTACHVRGAEALEGEIAGRLKLEPGQTAADLSYSFETVNCLGACAMAPVVVVNGKYHGNVRLNDVKDILGPGRES
jgi:NADH-quinone oxidoreductase subunit E